MPTFIYTPKSIRTLTNAVVLGAVLLAPVFAHTASTQTDSSTQLLEPHLLGGGAGQYLAGFYAERIGNDGHALDFYALASAHDNLSTADLHLRIHFLALTEGQLEKSLQALNELEAKGGSSPYAHLLRGVIAIKVADYGAIDGLYEDETVNLVRLLSPGIEAWAKVGENDEKAALANLAKLNEKPGLSPTYELHMALMQERLGNAEAAEAHYAAVAKNTGIDVHIAALMGNYYERRGQFENTRELYEKFPENGEGAVLLAAAEARQKKGVRPPLDASDPQKGVAELLYNFATILQTQPGDERSGVLAHMALYLNPDHTAAQMVLASSLESSERYDEANALYSRIPKTSPFSWRARRNMADNFDRLDQTDKAIKMLRSMAQERPSDFIILVDLGNVLRRHDKYLDAIKAYGEALDRIETMEDRYWTILYSRGIAYEQTKQWSQAEADFLKALELKPDQPEVLNYLGYSWIDQGVNLERALKMIEKAVDLRPRDGYIVDSLGWGLYRLERFEEAVKKLERAAMLRPADPIINDHLGDALWKVGRTREARFQWERARNQDPDETLLKQLDKKLKDGL